MIMVAKFARKIAMPLSLASVALVPFAVHAQDAVVAGAAVSASDYVGKMVYGPKGERLGAIYKVGQDGAAQVIISGKMVNIPAATLNLVDGKLKTSMDKRTLTSAR